LASVLLVGTAGYGWGATAAAPAKEPDKASPSLDAVMGKKLVSIDGSIIVLSAAQEGLVRQITSPNGAVQKTSFNFISDTLGTVADSADTRKVVAVFRATETALEIKFADGTSELLLANSSGGISIESTSAAKEAFCTAWYPEGHAFTMDERKAALAQYAIRLGIGDGAQKGGAGSPCGSAPARVIEAKADVVKTDATKTDAPKSDAAKADPAPTPAATTPAPAGPRGRRGAALRPVAPRQAMLGDMKQVEVRNSEVHPVPEDIAPASPDVASKQVVATLETPAPKVAADPKPQALAPADKTVAATTAVKPADTKATETTPIDAKPEAAAALEKPAAVTPAAPAAAAKLAETKPADAKAPEAKVALAETKSADAKAPEAKVALAETKPPDAKAPVAKAAEEKPQVVAALEKPAAPKIVSEPPPKASETVTAVTAAKPADAKPAEAKAADAKASEPKPQVVATLEKPAPVTPAPALTAPAVSPAAPALRGASSCLSIESDGSHWGFRNHCSFTVQFAYCQMSAGGQPASCKDGTVPGSVAPNGFGALVADQSLKETDVQHDFRWVACQGGAGEVIPRLEQMDPPVGRCVR
jgi:hypothetical protein